MIRRINLYGEEISKIIWLIMIAKCLPKHGFLNMAAYYQIFQQKIRDKS